MGSVDERTAIGTLFSQGWADRTPVEYPNRSITPPQNDYWARLTILNADAAQQEIGAPNNQHRFPGLVVVQIFGPLNVGDAVIRQHADVAAAIFAGKVVSAGENGSVRFRTPTIRDIGKDKEELYYQFNVSVPFNRDAVF